METNNPNNNSYDPKKIEEKWIKEWEVKKIYSTPTSSLSKEGWHQKPKMHVLDMFPYPSGEGLHAGHAKIFGASDIYSRFKRMQGYNVLHATGWDAFGLPAEQFAIKNKENPKVSTKRNIDTYIGQMKSLGLSYDWDRTVNTTDPKFYKWTQWIFKQLYKSGLCYESNEPINWCPSCKTGLANEDLDNGLCERCGSMVEKKPIRQWVIKITDYAEKLLKGVDDLDWKENIKEMQRNWIGKSEGAEIEFEITPTQPSLLKEKISVFTTRPDTLFGATYLVLSPEHEFVKKLILENEIENISDVKKYVDEAKSKTEIERTSLGKEKTGVKLEAVWAINPANGEKIPVYIADYVLNNYGTGAIMAVPAHDERDYEFAKKYNIAMVQVIVDPRGSYIEGNTFTEQGILKNSGKFDGMNSAEAMQKITETVGGKMVTKYKLKDWVFARQRYWGEPFPIVFDENHKSYVVADSELPIVLPDVEFYEPTGNGEGPLADMQDWVEVWGYINDEGEFVSVPHLTSPSSSGGTGPEGQEVKKFYRETNTMPQWAGSSWYWLRYMDPHNENRFVGREEEKYWSQNNFGADVYLGGLEHATRHLIYGRFWNLFLHEKGIISHGEPFKRLEAVGLVLGKDGLKMSKRLKNIVNPDDVVKQFGADTMRAYVAFAGSFHNSFVWDEKAIIGPRRFIERVWNLQFKVPHSTSSSKKDGSEKDLEILLNQTIKKVGEDYEKLQFNTAIAQMMIYVNAIEKHGGIGLEDYNILLKLLAPVCPFFTEEIWVSLNSTNDSIHLSDWPKYDKNKIQNQNVNIAVQVNGKLRDVFETEVDQTDDLLKVLAQATDGYKKWVADSVPKKTIIVKNKIINIIL